MHSFILTLDAMVCILSVAVFQYTAITIFSFAILAFDLIAAFVSTYNARMIQSTSLIFAIIATVFSVVIYFLLYADYFLLYAEAALVMTWYVALATAWRIYYMNMRS
jgi:hypothetical protein